MNRFHVTGMTCSACSASVERAVRKLDFVREAQVNLLTGELKVAYLDSDDHADAVVRAVADAGYAAAPEAPIASQKASEANEPPKARADEAAPLWRRFIGSLCFLVPLMALSMQHMLGYPLPAALDVHRSPLMHTFLQLCLVTPVLWLGRGFFTSGYRKLLHGAPNMDTLVAIGSTAAYGYSFFLWLQMLSFAQMGQTEQLMPLAMGLYFEAAAMILALITLGKALEARAKQKTTFAIEKLILLAPQDAALVQPDGSTLRVPVSQLKPGDELLVLAGERVAVDGVLLSGHAAMNEAHLTGESLPVDKQRDDALAAGSMNLQGAIRMRVTKVGEDTTLARIIRLVEEAGGSKAPIAKLADQVSGVFVPVVLGIALVTLIVWLAVGEPFRFALSCAIAVLVISCPCALGLATPVAIMVGTGVGAQHGVLFRNGTVLETLHHVQSVVLDKTGTLTTGRMRLAALHSLSGDADGLLRIAAAIESGSEHPIGKAICEAAREKRLPPLAASAHETQAGLGISATIDGARYAAGNRRMMEQLGVPLQPGEPAVQEALAQGCSILYLAREDTLLGVLGVADTIKEEAPWTVEQLKRLHIRPVLLTGDHRVAASVIAGQAGIDDVISEVLPQEKSQTVANLQNMGQRVAMVGDGVNDAPALKQADIGIAMGSGTDIAIETSDVVLSGDRLSALPTAIRLSRATIRNIRQNLFWAFFYNTLGIPIAAGALYPAFGITLNPMLGAAAMSLSSVFVVTNALRLKRFRAPTPPLARRDTKKEEPIMQQKTIFVEGMSCNHCKASVEKALMKLPQVEYAEVDLAAKKALVTLDSPASDDTLRAAITEAGFTVTDIQ